MKEFLLGMCAASLLATAVGVSHIAGLLQATVKHECTVPQPKAKGMV